MNGSIGAYAIKPERLLEQLSIDFSSNPSSMSACAGFELQAWRCNALSSHLIDWISDYALREEELHVNHSNMYVKIREAAIRIYTSEKYEKRGEVGEIILHSICRDFFDTIPISPRVFYLSSSNDVVKSFDMAHVRYLDEENIELWLGEAKFYKNSSDAVSQAISSIKDHIDQGFLNREKLLLGPQISKDLPHYQKIRHLFSEKTSLDKLFASAVFPICIACDSDAAATGVAIDDAYREAVLSELEALRQSLIASGLASQIRLVLLYVPLGCKASLAEAFDKRLKGLTL